MNLLIESDSYRIREKSICMLAEKALDSMHPCRHRQTSTRTSEGENGNDSVSLPIILIKNEVHQKLPSSYISPLLVSI